MKDFFISYNKADKPWAEWIAWTLEESGYSVVIQAWDFRPGGNFVLKMHEAASETKKTIAVLSDHYLNAEYTQPEWAAAFARDPKGVDRTLIPIRVEQCAPQGLLSQLMYIDLISHSQESARTAILEGLKERAKPDEAPNFPGFNAQGIESAIERVVPHPVPFPGSNSPEDGQPPEEENHLEIPWNVPTGVPFFTGREDVLSKLHDALIEGKTAVLAQRQAISGLGGIGKTQTAIAYAIRHRDDYKAVLWAVAESRESLMSDFVAFASLLDLPERNIQDQNLVVSAVRRWLKANTDWLLILDNADDPGLIEDLLPPGSNGHILLTSRAQVFDNIGILNPIEMEEMSPEDAKEFLLRRTGRRDLELSDEKAIEELAFELDYLPLALEQAGAYIKELRSSFQDYLASYRKRGLELLEKGSPVGKGRKSIRTTWSLNFQQVEAASKAAADLLRVSAFLSPDRIPNELISWGAVKLGPELSSALANVDSDPLALDEVLKPLIRYSLIHRDRTSKTYDIHRLVQAVLKEGLDDEVNRVWAERTVNAVAHVLPEIDLDNISMSNRIERILPHSQACSELIERWNFVSLDAAELLNNMGRYLHFRARLSEAELLYNRSLEIRWTLLGTDHGDVASSLHNQGWVCYDQGRYTMAEAHLIRSLAIREQSLDPYDVKIASSLDKLAQVYVEQGEYSKADELLARALRIKEKALGPEHPDTVENLLSQSSIRYHFGRDVEAEALLIRSLAITERRVGSEHKRASILNNLALVYERARRFDEAERLFLQALSLDEEVYGANYPHVAGKLNNLGYLYIRTGRYTEAEALIVRSMEIREKVLGHEHPDLVSSFQALGLIRAYQGNYTEAELLYSKSLRLAEKALGESHIRVADVLIEFARLYNNWHKSHKADPLIRRALSIRKRVLGPEHLRVGETMTLQADILTRMNRKGEAQKIEAQARKIRAKHHKLNKKGE